MSKWEQYRHLTRYQPGGSAICGTSGSATAVRVKTGMTSSVPHSFPLAPQPLDILFPCVLRKCFNAVSARERKGKPPVILPHAVHVHSVPCL